MSIGVMERNGASNDSNESSGPVFTYLATISEQCRNNREHTKISITWKATEGVWKRAYCKKVSSAPCCTNSVTIATPPAHCQFQTTPCKRMTFACCSLARQTASARNSRRLCSGMSARRLFRATNPALPAPSCACTSSRLPLRPPFGSCVHAGGSR